MGIWPRPIGVARQLLTHADPTSTYSIGPTNPSTRRCAGMRRDPLPSASGHVPIVAPTARGWNGNGQRVKRTALKRKTPLRAKRKWTAVPKPKTETEILDDLVRQIVLIRDGFKCVRCSKGISSGRGLQVAHLMPKGHYPALRHELENVLLMCWNCHLGPKGWHKNPIDSWGWLNEFKGPKFVENLRWLARTRSKVDKAAVRFQLGQELNRLMPRQAHPIEGWSERTPAPRSVRR